MQSMLVKSVVMKYNWEATLLKEQSTSIPFENGIETAYELVKTIIRIKGPVAYHQSHKYNHYLFMCNESAIVISDHELIVMVMYGSDWYRIRRIDG